MIGPDDMLLGILNARNIFARAHTLSTLANLTVIILLSEMLKFSNFIFSKSKKYCERQ
jgi:hypothetical protein